MKITNVTSLALAAGLIAGCALPEQRDPDLPPPVPFSLAYTPAGPPLTIDQLPNPAQWAIRSQINFRHIAEITEREEEGVTIYTVKLERKNWHSGSDRLEVTQYGAVLMESPDLMKSNGMDPNAPAPIASK
jgi:hypothetical protein